MNGSDATPLVVRKEDEILVVRKMLELGYQVEPETVGQLLAQEGDPELVLRILELVVRSRAKERGKQFVINSKDIQPYIRAKADSQQIEEVVPMCEVVFDPSGLIDPTADTSGYLRLFRSRLEKMSSMMRSRPDFFQIEKLNAIKTPKLGKKVLAKVVGLVVSKKVSGDYVTLTLEDETGYLRLMCTDDAIRKVEDVLLDEFILVEVESMPRGYYARNVYHPDVPERTPRMCDEKVYAILVSDLHVGSPSFDEQAFQKMVDWLNGDLGELEITSRVAYMILNGDLIENPLSRDGRLNEKSIENCYEELAGWLTKIRGNVKIIIVPGEADATRTALPQPAIIRKYARRLYEMRNVVMVGNPSMVKLHGVNVLLFHGQSLDEVFRQLQSTSITRPTSGIRVLLKARHLAPTYGGLTMLAPEKQDLLVVDPVPDIIHCGHTGFPDEDLYRGTLMVSTPSWISGMKSDSRSQGRAALVNLSTFEVLWRA
jgi:DNA polymerase II small subunit